MRISRKLKGSSKLRDEGRFMRVFIDSSTIIALVRIGELTFLRDIFGKIYITKSIEKEVLTPNYPDAAIIRKAVGDWIISIGTKGAVEAYKIYGLGEGEATLFLTRKEDVLIIDELNARRLAGIEGRTYTGLLGLIAAAAESKLITKIKALSMVDKLSESSFRMSTPLYKKIMKRIAEVEE